MSLVYLAAIAAKMVTDQMRRGQCDEGRHLIQLDSAQIDVFEQEMIEGIVSDAKGLLLASNSLGSSGLGNSTIYCNQYGADWRSIEMPAEAIGLARNKIYDYVPDIHLRIKNGCLYRAITCTKDELVFDGNLCDDPEVMAQLSKEVAELINRMSDPPPVKQLTVEPPEITRATDLKVDQQFSLKKDGIILTVISIKSITKFALQIEVQDKAKTKKIDLSSDTIVYLKE